MNQIPDKSLIRIMAMCFLGLLGLVLLLALTACTTVTDDEGRTTTSFDARAATDAVNLGFTSYDRYRAYRNPPPAYVTPVQPAYPVYYP